MGLKQLLFTRLFPQDKANHYMRGTIAAMVGACAAMFVLALYFVFGLEERRLILLWWPATAAVASAAAAYAVGVWKESRDAIANAISRAHGGQDVHNVETGDWQFTAWGALPVSGSLLMAQLFVFAVTNWR